MRDEALRWFSEALWDLETAEILHREKRYNAAAFYSHQAAEKAIKALLYYLNEAPWGHSIRILLERYFRKVGIEPDRELLICARELDRHYVTSRYPNTLPGGTPHEAYDEYTSERAIECAKKIVNFAKQVLQRE